MELTPSGAVAPLDELGVEITELGARFTKPLPHNQWRNIMLGWSVVKHAMPWCIGDGLNYGEAEYGEMYAQVADETGLHPSYLANLKYVTARFPHERRRPTIINLSTYQVIASLPEEEQEWWLDLIELNNWKRDDVRLALREHRSEEKEEEMIVSSPDDSVFSPRDVSETFEYLRTQWHESWVYLDELGVPENDAAGNPLPLVERFKLALSKQGESK